MRNRGRQTAILKIVPFYKFVKLFLLTNTEKYDRDHRGMHWNQNHNETFVAAEVPMDNREDRIRRRAYELWQAAGSPRGDGAEFWLQAEAEVAQTDPAIAEDTPDAAARREIEREKPGTVVQVEGRK